VLPIDVEDIKILLDAGMVNSATCRRGRKRVRISSVHVSQDSLELDWTALV